MNIRSLRRPATGAAVVLAALAAATPALAAPIGDGTSNTIQVASASLDQAHHRVVITGAPAGMTPGRHFARATIVTPQLSYVFTDVMIESVVGTTTSLSLNYSKMDWT
jgi:hypothetical protein